MEIAKHLMGIHLPTTIVTRKLTDNPGIVSKCKHNHMVARIKKNLLKDIQIHITFANF